MSTIKVHNSSELDTAIEAGYAKGQIEIVHPDHSAAITAAREEGKAAGLAEAKTASVEANKTIEVNAQKAERTRLTALAEIAQEGFEAEYKAAIDGGHSAADFALAMHNAKKDRGITTDAIRKDSKGARHASAPQENAASAEAKAGWGQVVAKHGGKKAA